MCPSSNVQTRAVTSFESHPLEFYFDYGLRVTINTDNRLITDTTVTKELWLCHERMGFTLEDLCTIIVQGFKSAFLPFREKAELLRDVNAEIAAVLARFAEAAAVGEPRGRAAAEAAKTEAAVTAAAARRPRPLLRRPRPPRPCARAGTSRPQGLTDAPAPRPAGTFPQSGVRQSRAGRTYASRAPRSRPRVRSRQQRRDPRPATVCSRGARWLGSVKRLLAHEAPALRPGPAAGRVASIARWRPTARSPPRRGCIRWQRPRRSFSR